MAATITANTCLPTRNRNLETVIGRSLLGTQTGMKLQPNFVEWVMGYPKDWTELPDSKLLEMRLSRKLQKKSLKE